MEVAVAEGAGDGVALGAVVGLCVGGGAVGVATVGVAVGVGGAWMVRSIVCERKAPPLSAASWTDPGAVRVIVTMAVPPLVLAV